MRARARVALVSLVMSVGGLAGCGSLDKLSDTTTGWLVPPESPPAKITPGAETSEPSAEDGQSGTKTADTPPEKKDKPARKPRPQTAKVPKKPAAPARAAAAVQPQSPEPKSAPAQVEPVQHPWPAAPPAGTFSR
jgi:hypothetical protein